MTKILTLPALLDAIGTRPRARTVALVHGVFDIVHPGHVRHLTYTKVKADVLVASVTADRHVTKGTHRPFVPERLRAESLAALTVVDYVVITDEPTALPVIAAIQPDLFAKGFEYSQDGMPPATQDEARAVEAYGGAMLFTPGDVRYSSSALLAQHEPKIALEKLLALMDAEGLDWSDIEAPIHDVGLRVHVVGDVILDRYTDCQVLGLAGKATGPDLLAGETREYAGGAAVMANTLANAGAKVTLGTVEDGRTVPTKHRYIVDGRIALQVDNVDNRPISEAATRTLAHEIEDSHADAIIFSDFRHGIFHGESIPLLTAAARATGALLVADSQVASRWGNVLDFHGFDLITPNEQEARFSLGDQDSTIRNLADRLVRESACGNLLLKLGRRGLLGARGEVPLSPFAVDSLAEEVRDPIGAGDAMLAYATLGLARSGSLVVAGILGSVAAGLACEHIGNDPVTGEAVSERLALLQRRARYEA